MESITGRSRLCLLVLLIGSVLTLAYLAKDVAEAQWTALDVASVPAGARLHLVDLAMTALTLAGGGMGVLLLGAGAFTVLLIHRRFWDAVFFAAAFEGARLLSLVLKELSNRPRPFLAAGAADALPAGHGSAIAALAGVVVVLALLTRRRWQALLFAGSFVLAVAIDRLAKWMVVVEAGHGSFPSGHAVSSMALFTALVLLTWSARWRWVTMAVGAGLVVGVGASRVYLGFHYPSDIVGGWCLALSWAIGVWLVLSARMPATRAAPGTGS